MGEQFTPYEQALKLKELGFKNNYNFKEYDTDGCLQHTGLLESHKLESIDAPLWQQAFDWFRITHNLYGSPEFIEKGLWSALIINIKTENIMLDKECDSYEEVRLECLKKLIEIVKNE